MSKVRADYQTRFQGKGIGTKHKQKPVSVMLPEEIDMVIRAMPNRSEFIRQAIIEKLERENCA
jgi:hypothetical protein